MKCTPPSTLLPEHESFAKDKPQQKGRKPNKRPYTEGLRRDRLVHQANHREKRWSRVGS